MSFLFRIVVVALVSVSYFSGGVKSLLSLSAQASPSQADDDAEGFGAGATAGGCGMYIPKK